ncbi:MAG TPA: metalloregulator ArsR/SmtB family transcription factor [Terriglobia bacterium]|nr:metalloregulator ArsR/SmtB family transcription factor [Terriglobia bacterium]
MVGASHLRLVEASEGDEQEGLSLVFGALADPVRRAILDRLDGQDLLVSEVAAHFDISLQAVSRHLQVLVRAGLVQQERTGRISRCSLDAGPIHEAAVWLNRYSKYWQDQFDLLAASLAEIVEEQAEQPSRQPHRPGQDQEPGRRAGKSKKPASKRSQPRRGPDLKS